MGWRNVGKATEVIVGDGGFDAVEVMLRAITSDYEEKLSRKPTLQEVLMTLEMILKGSGHQYLNGLDESDLVEIKAKTRPRRKRQPFQTGDFFVVPLEKGKFGFGRVLQLEGGTILGFYNVASSKVESLAKISERPYLFVIMTSDEGLESWRWKVIGFAPLRKGEFTMPDFCILDSIDPTRAEIYSKGKYRKATIAETKGLEQFAIWTPGTTEKRLADALTKKRQSPN